MNGGKSRLAVILMNMLLLISVLNLFKLIKTVLRLLFMFYLTHGITQNLIICLLYSLCLILVGYLRNCTNSQSFFFRNSIIIEVIFCFNKLRHL